jgi:hypothetical protein
MATFSGRSAFASGFKVIGRNPLAFLAWCLVYLVVALGPLALMGAMVWPQLQALAALNEADVSPDSPAATQQMMALMGQMNAFQLLQWGSSLASSALIVGAVFRAVLEPERRSFFYLRFGRQELWLALCLVVVGVVLFLVTMISMFPIFITTALFAYAAEPSAGLAPSVVLACGAMVLIALGAIIWLFLRFSLGLPMSFADSYFRLFESWSLTRGQVGKMVVVGVLVSVVTFVIQALLFTGFIAAAFAILQPTAEMDVTALTFAQMAPVVGVAAVLMAVVSVLSTTLYLAPLADIYRQLVAQRESA